MKVKDLIKELQQLDLERDIFLGKSIKCSNFGLEKEDLGISMNEFDIEEHLYDKEHSFTILEDTIEENIGECYVIM